MARPSDTYQAPLDTRWTLSHLALRFMGLIMRLRRIEELTIDCITTYTAAIRNSSTGFISCLPTFDQHVIADGNNWVRMSRFRSDSVTPFR